MAGDTTRRTAVLGLTAIGGLTTACGAPATVQTPRATAGPFYPTRSMRRADIDNDLVKIRSLVDAATGEVVLLRGVLTDPAGSPRADHRVEIWQCDANGHYLHTGDSGSSRHDEAFQGFGHDITDAQGRFSFRTIKPAAYPGRTPHIHAMVIDGDGATFATQFYIKDHPSNARDVLFRRMSEAEADLVSMVFREDAGDTVADIRIII